MKPIRLFLIFITALSFACCSVPVKNEAAASVSSTDTTTAKGQISMQSEITCPKCGHKKVETMPADVCVLKYNCENCNFEMHPKGEDCCVFCSYGSKKCPSMQE
ncbi:MAG: GDCCVxC domain-containing (seleno)protein [Bacteroidia bacterium]